MFGAARRAEDDPPEWGWGNSSRANHRVGACVAMVATTVALAGCSGGNGAPHAAPGTTVTSTGGASPTTTTPSAATKSASPATTRPATTPAKLTGQETLPFVADTNPDVSTARDGSPVLVSVTKGLHDGYIRYVFLFKHSDPDGHQPWRQFAQPAWDARYVSRDQAVQDGSGRPVANVGADAHLRIRFEANMHDGAEGQNTLQSSVSEEDALAFGGDFEGRVQWFHGSDRQRPFRVFYAGDGRVVVDIVD